MEYAGESWVKGAEEHSAAIQAKSWDMTVKHCSYLFFSIEVLSLGKNFLKVLPWRLKMHLMNNFPALFIQIAVSNGRNICNMDLLEKKCASSVSVDNIKRKNRQTRVTQQCQEENSPVLLTGADFFWGYSYKPWPVGGGRLWLYTFLWQASELMREILVESTLQWPQSET